MRTADRSKTKWGVVGAVVAAVAASACCTVPLVLVALGASGAWLGTFAALAPFRPLFVALALGALAYAGYREYRTSSGPDCDCEVTVQDRLRRALLVGGLVVTLGLIASPWILRGTATQAGAPALVEPALQEVVLDVEGMTCAACNVTVQKALSYLDGVRDARVTFEPPQAFVTFDPSKVSIEQMIEATTHVGYPARPRQRS